MPSSISPTHSQYTVYAINATAVISNVTNCPISPSDPTYYQYINVLGHALAELMPPFQASNNIKFSNFKLSCGGSASLVSDVNFVISRSNDMTANFQIIFQSYSLNIADGNLTYAMISHSLSAGVTSQNITRLIRKYAIVYSVPGLSSSSSSTPINLSPPIEKSHFSESSSSNQATTLPTSTIAGIIVGVVVFCISILLAIYIILARQSTIRKDSIIDYNRSYPEADGRVSLPVNRINDTPDNDTGQSPKHNGYSRASFGVEFDQVRQSISPFRESVVGTSDSGRDSVFARLVASPLGSVTTRTLSLISPINNKREINVSTTTMNTYTNTTASTNVHDSRISDPNKFSSINSPNSSASNRISDIDRSRDAPSHHIIKQVSLSISIEVSEEARTLESITASEVIRLLKYWGVRKYESQFNESGIDGTILARVNTVDDLKDCSLYLPGPLARSLVNTLNMYKSTGVPVKLLE